MADAERPEVLREPLPADRAELEWLIAEAENHVAECNAFYFRVRLLQQMQIEIVGPLARSDSAYEAFLEALRTGEIERLLGHDAAYRDYLQSDIAKDVHRPNVRLLRYLNLVAFRTDDVFAEKLQARQATLFRTDIRCQFEHRESLRAAGDPAIPDKALNGSTRKKYAEWEGNCQSLIDYYRTWRDAEVPFVNAFVVEAKRHLADLDAAAVEVAAPSEAAVDPPSVNRSLPPHDELNVKAREFLRLNPAAGCRPIGRAIGCSPNKVRTLPAYIAVEEKRKASRAAAPRAESFSDQHAESIGEGDRHKVLSDLIAGQEAEMRDDEAPRRFQGRAVGRRRKA